jgi:hypothetical protein
VLFARLLDVIDTWLTTGRFPREELRVRREIAIPFVAVILLLAFALADRALGG